MKSKAKNLFDISGKTALVTGASRGIGKAIAIGLGNAGVKVICSSSKAKGTDDTVKIIKENGGQAQSIVADLTNARKAERLATITVDRHGPIDILINNAGTIARHKAEEFPVADWNIVMQVNLSSAFRICQLIGKHMIENGGGKIINIASMLSHSGGITVPAYTASKHGLAGVTKALANEWAIHNLQINAVAPGYIKTDNTQALQDDRKRNKAIKARIPTGRWGNPEDIVGTVLYLSSPASDYVNGTIINVDGGWMSS